MHIENDIYFNMFSCLLEHKMSNYRKSPRGQPNFHYQLPYTVSDSHGITITKLTALSHCAVAWFIFSTLIYFDKRTKDY